MFDYFRVIGNEAVHPGQIDLNDNIDHSRLFYFMNYMIEMGIIKPKEIDKMYNHLPINQKKAIVKRDNLDK